ncbi:MAG: CCA tRNA nucleotidyltransferase [Anaerolineae bacterium]|nr:MAG: CCA tRNA nucleotidyltransferase [Anaerolineae bacterium]
MPTLVERLLPSDLASLIRSQSNGQQVWLVGGALRDHFLDLEQPDLDFAVADRAISLARGLADALELPCYVLDEQRDAARVVLPGRATLDFARLRAPSIEADLGLRDFSMNALAVELDDPERLIDPLGGLQDLKDRVLRACARDSIERDVIRSLRAVRLSASLTLRLEDQTKEQVRQSAATLSACAAERRRDELSKMLSSVSVATAMRLMRRLELLPGVLPELAALTPDAWDQTLRIVDRLADLMGAVVSGFESERAGNLPRAELSLRLGRYRVGLGEHLMSTLRGGHRSSQMLFFAALHSEVDEAPDTAYLRARELRYSEAEAARARSIVRSRDRAGGLEMTDLGAHRFFRDCGAAGVEAVLLSLANSSAQSPPQEVWELNVNVARELLEAWFENHERIVDPPRLLRGDELAAALDLMPGPIIGKLLAAIAEAQVEGRIESEREALEYARERLPGLS